jgi:DNA repair protein RadC
MIMEGDSPEYGPLLTAEGVSNYLRQSGHEMKDREVFIVLLLNVKNRIIAEEIVSVGILDGAIIHPREVFKAAIVGSAAGIIVAHNHPSGDPTPSIVDGETTKRLREAGKILGIPLIDHVIISPGEVNNFYSFREKSDWNRYQGQINQADGGELVDD